MELRLVDGKAFRTSYPRLREFNLAIKSRWHGKSLLEVFASEYTSRPREYYENAITRGHLKAVGPPGQPPNKKLRVTENVSPLQRPLRGNERITHTCLLSEAVAPLIDPQVLFIDAQKRFLVVDKPAGIPCYPQGPFETNSLDFLLKENEELIHLLGRSDSFSPLSRLDRVTGGLVTVATSGAECRDLLPDFKTWVKGYLARVESATWAAVLHQAEELEYAEVRTENDQKYIVCTAPLEKQQHEPGTALRVGVVPEPRGKPSCSIFWLLEDAEDGLITLLCIPVTGRTHQLRAHLKYLNAPIKGDPLYNIGCLKDTKVHSEWYFVQYSTTYTKDLLNQADIKHGLRQIPVKNLHEVRLTGPKPKWVEKVYQGADEALKHREGNSYPDFGLIGETDEYMLISLHPNVLPSSIDLHAAFYQPRKSFRDLRTEEVATNCFVSKCIPVWGAAKLTLWQNYFESVVHLVHKCATEYSIE